MSTPVDIPQNIHIHVSHAEKVVEPQRPDVADNSARQSSLELANKETDHKRHEIKRDKENKKKFDDFYAQKQKNKNKQKDMKDREENEKMVTDNNLKEMDIGRKIDISL